MSDTPLDNLAMALGNSCSKTLDRLGDPLFVVDRDLRILSVNHAFREWMDHLDLHTTLRGKHISDVFSFLSPHILEEYGQVFDIGETLVTSEVTEFRGQEVFTDTRRIPVFANGEVVRVVTIIRDVTEQRLLERTFEDYHEQFKQYRTTSEERFSTIFNESPVSICVFDKDGILTHANPACATMFGLSSSNDLFGHDLFAAPDVPDWVWMKLINGERVEFEWVFDIEPFARTREYETTKSGIMHIGTLVSPIRSNEHLNGWVVQMQDITQWRNAQQQLKHARDVALEYIDIMSHDIANYLQSIMMCSGLASEVMKQAGKSHILHMMDEAIFDCIELIAQARRASKELNEKAE